MNVREVDGEWINPIAFERLRSRGVPIHRPHDAIHQQHGAAVGLDLDQLGDEIGIGAVRLDVQRDADFTRDREIFDERFVRFEVEASVDGRPVARGTMVGVIGAKAPALGPR